MFGWLLVVLFASVLAREKVKTPVVLNGVLDERVTYIPLGYNQIFNCEAEAKIAYLVRSQPVWYVLFYNLDTKAMERTNVSSIRNKNNERFRQLDNSSLLVIGIQKWHDGVVVECVLDTGHSSSVVSRHTIAVQDCYEEADRNPCLYGKCGVDGFKGVYEVVRCDCIPQFTGDFCSEPVEDVLFEEVIFYSPMLFLIVFIVIIFCARKKIEFAGKYKPMRFERQITRFNPLPSKGARYPAAFLLCERTAESHRGEFSSKEPGKKEPDGEETSKTKLERSRASKKSRKDPAVPSSLILNNLGK